jgi:large subunit ribosomal protein L20
MTRVKRGTISAKTRRYTLKATKGMRFGRSTKERMAFDALSHAGKYAFNHRRDKKGDFRRQWQVIIGAAVHTEGLSYSKFIGALKKKGIALDRKIMADLAKNAPATFSKVVAAVK